MTVTSFSSILHPTDFSAASELAFAHALKLALLTRARFDIVHTERPADDIDWTAFPGVRAMLEKWGLLAPGSRPSAVSRQLGVQIRKVDVKGRDPVKGVMRFINDHPCDLVVLATHGRGGWQRWRSGSIAEPIARRAKTPTLFLPHAARGFIDLDTGGVRLRRILVAVDYDPRPEPAVTEAWQLARALGAEDARLHALYVGDAGDAPALRSMPEVGGRVELIARPGGVVDRIVETATELDVDLVVMATRGHEGVLDALRGSTTEQVLHRAARALLAVPAPGT